MIKIGKTDEMDLLFPQYRQKTITDRVKKIVTDPGHNPNCFIIMKKANRTCKFRFILPWSNASTAEYHERVQSQQNHLSTIHEHS